jgi:microcystin-dependent protein
VAETTTVNFGWTMPDPGASANTWGATLNATTQKVDAQVFANQQAAIAGQAPIGGGALWFTATPPAGWLICDGSSLLRTGTYAALFAIIGTTFGAVDSTHFNLPPLIHRFPLGAGPNPLGSTGGGAADGTFNYTIALANLPSHSHPITDVQHNHTATQPAHTHPDPGHTHSASEAAHSHGSNLMRFTGGSGQPLGIGSGGNSNVNYGNSDAAQPAITVNGALAGLQAAQPAVTVTAAFSNINTTQAVGSGAPINIVPLFCAVNFIIRYQ